jgi:hypothetical protein
MGDPVITPQLLAAAGAGIGALSKPRNPLQGALLGGIAGYSGGTALGFGAPAATTASAATTAAGTSAANTALASQMVAQPALSYAGGNIANAAASTLPSAASNAAGLSFAGMSPGAANVANTAPSFMDKIGMAGKSAYENPMMTSQALGATQGLLTPEQMPSPAPAMPLQAGRGVKPYDPMASLDPYKQSVVGGQPISLI